MPRAWIVGWFALTLLPTLGGCSRSGFSGSPAAQLTLVKVEPDSARVVAGQRQAPVRVQIRNDSAEQVQLLLVRLHFSAGSETRDDSFVVSDAGDNPTAIAAGTTVSALLLVDVLSTAQPESVVIDAEAQAELPNRGLLAASGAAETASWQVVVGQESTELTVLSITTDIDQVVPGQSQIGVDVRLENGDPDPLQILSIEPRLAIASQDVSGDYLFQAAGSNVTTVPGNSSATLRLYLELVPNAALGNVTLDAIARGQQADGDVVIASHAAQTDSFTVVHGSPGDLTIAAISSSASHVYPGQLRAPVQLQVVNQHDGPITIAASGLHFSDSAGIDCSADFAVAADPSNPTTLAAGSGGTLRFSVDVGAAVAPGSIAVNGWVTGFRDNSSVAADDRADVPITWEVLSGNPGDLEISSVVASADQIYPGQSDLPVTLRLLNRSSGAIEVNAVALRFALGSSDLSAEYTVQASGGNPVFVPASGSSDLLFWVTAAGTATAGNVVIDASAQGRRQDLSTVTAGHATLTDGWNVVGSPALVVTTASDEDDIGAGNASVSAAGGESDLSLREAIRIANAAATPTVIRFDPVIFAPAGATRIDVTGALGPLPAIGRAGIQIDASDAGVVIDGNGGSLDGISVSAGAHDVVLRHLTFSRFGGDSDRCLAASGVDRLTVDDCTFVDCGYPWGNAVQIIGGRDHRIERCLFESNPGVPVGLDNEPASVVVDGNIINGTPYVGVHVTGVGHQVTNNTFTAIEYSGVVVDGLNTSGVSIRGNTFADVNYSHDADDAPIVVAAGARDIVIEQNSISTDGPHSVLIADLVTVRVSVRNNSYSTGDTRPIALSNGANEAQAAPAITAFDGSQIQGTAIAGSTIEIYAIGTSWQRMSTIANPTGTWTISATSPLIAVAATATNGNGSTSEFSAIARADNGSLLVTTTDDELDGGAAITTVAQAGGAADLSLREAIVIANNRYGPDTIRFDSAVFPAASERTIAVGAGMTIPEPLPEITDGDTTIDGSGSLVAIDGGTRAFAEGTDLLLTSGVRTRFDHLIVRNVTAVYGSCIGIFAGGNDSQVTDCNLSNCTTPGTGSGLWLNCVAGTVITNNVIRNSNVGIEFEDTGISVATGNDISLNADDGIVLACADGALLQDNAIHDNGCDGIWFYESGHNRIIGNRIWNNESGIHLDGYSGDQEIVFNSLVGNGRGLLVDGSAQDLVLRNNLFALSLGFGVELASSAGSSADHQLFFDNNGDGVTGANACSLAGQLGPTDVLADPQLINAVAGDLTPRAGVIDRGVDIGYDRNGAAAGLFNGSAPDIGAIETP